jgi:hypothetical protein
MRRSVVFRPGATLVHADRQPMVAMAYGHYILLLWIDISRLRIPSFLLVSPAVDLYGPRC